MGRTGFLENLVVPATPWRTISNPVFALLSVALFVSLIPVAQADEFDRLEGSVFFEIPRRPDVRSHGSLSFAELDALPTVLRGERSALVIVQTDQGNLAKMLISYGLRRQNPADDPDSAAPS